MPNSLLRPLLSTALPLAFADHRPQAAKLKLILPIILPDRAEPPPLSPRELCRTAVPPPTKLLLLFVYLLS